LLDANVPAENVVLSHYMTDTARWLAVSEASDGRIFFGTGNTEVLARRAAGLRTLAHLEERAAGKIEGQAERDRHAAKAELIAELDRLSRMVAGYNGPFPATVGRDVLLAQVRAARDVTKATDTKGIIAKYTLPVLLFVAAAFAEGVIGAYAQECLERVTRFLAA
jgi:hypothetical protein